MRFTTVILGAFFCLSAMAEDFSDKTSDEALIQAAEKLTSSAAPVDKKEQKESEIPVQLTPPFKAKDSGNIMWRLAASFGFLSLIAGILYYATRRWGRPKDKAAAGARIEMLHQFHMGPRRSLALVRVAGEAILIGVTDQNINMLKPVTLIDEELEGLMKKDFNNFLEDEFSIEDVRTALRA